MLLAAVGGGAETVVERAGGRVAGDVACGDDRDGLAGGAVAAVRVLGFRSAPVERQHQLGRPRSLARREIDAVAPVGDEDKGVDAIGRHKVGHVVLDPGVGLDRSAVVDRVAGAGGPRVPSQLALGPLGLGLVDGRTVLGGRGGVQPQGGLPHVVGHALDHEPQVAANFGVATTVGPQRRIDAKIGLRLRFLDARIGFGRNDQACGARLSRNPRRPGEAPSEREPEQQAGRAGLAPAAVLRPAPGRSVRPRPLLLRLCRRRQRRADQRQQPGRYQGARSALDPHQNNPRPAASGHSSEEAIGQHSLVRVKFIRLAPITHPRNALASPSRFELDIDSWLIGATWNPGRGRRALSVHVGANGKYRVGNVGAADLAA